jgi:small acid-soluble spore protein (thioredoxin-like protein)
MINETKRRMKMPNPKPDDRSDNVEKLQEMVDNTLENIEAAEETIQFSDGEEKQQIIDKNKRRGESIEAMRNEIKDEYHDQHQ